MFGFYLQWWGAVLFGTFAAVLLIAFNALILMSFAEIWSSLIAVFGSA